MLGSETHLDRATVPWGDEFKAHPESAHFKGSKERSER